MKFKLHHVKKSRSQAALATAIVRCIQLVVLMDRVEVLGSLCGTSQEGCGRLYRSLSQLLSLSELEEAGGGGGR